KPLRGPQGPLDDGRFTPDTVAFNPQALGTAPQPGQLPPGLRQAGIEGVQAEQGTVRAGREPGLPLPQRGGALLPPGTVGSRQECAQDEGGCEREPERKPALPTPTQGPD